jgi:anaerobic carbon-monoxide dehydrogenase iron sulfur subunit
LHFVMHSNMRKDECIIMKRLKFSKEKCIGCQLCAQVCSATHEGMYIPSKARIGIESYYEKGGTLKYKDSYCTLCGICFKNCPVGAISMDEKISVDHEICIGCGTCQTKCPKKVVKIIDKKSYICDTCNGDPMCVKVCPQGALKYE